MRLITRKKPRRAKRAIQAPRTSEQSQTARQPQGARRRPAQTLREMPTCLKNRKPGELLTNSQQIEVLEWMANCIRDAGVAAGLHQ